MLKVLLYTNLRAPYMVDYLNELGKSCELTAVFEIGRVGWRETSWLGKPCLNYREINLNARQLREGEALSFGALPYLFRHYDRIIIENPTTPTGILLLLTCRLFRIPHLIQSEGGFQGSGRGIKERFKLFLMGKASLYLTGMGGGNDYFLRYGATPERLRPYPFTSLSEADLPERVPTREEKRLLREKLGMTEEKIVLSVGRFIPCKGYPHLFRAAKELPAGTGLYLVGGEPTEEYLALQRELRLTGLHFVGFRDKTALLEYYAAADLFVLPTLGDTWGLVINEAMAAGLPVVTTDRCVAGVCLISDGENGRLVPAGDAGALAAALRDLLSDPAGLARMGEANLLKMRDYTIEKMAGAVYRALIE